MDWNERYVIQDTPWDKGAATPVLEEIWRAFPEVFQGKVILPGCGPGYEARWLAAKGCEVTGVDIAPLAIDKARELDVDGAVKFEVSDFLNPEAKFVGAFDVLFENTCFCALLPTLRENYLRSAFEVLKPGGTVAGVFFIDPEMDVGESGPPFGIGVETLKSMCEAAGFDVMESWVPVTGFQGRIGRELAMILKKR
jgi:SAM-dependent methyltransferase